MMFKQAFKAVAGIVESDEDAELDQRIKACATIEQGQIVEDVKVNGVVTRTAVEDVNAGTAIDGVVAAGTVNGVCPPLPRSTLARSLPVMISLPEPPVAFSISTS